MAVLRTSRVLVWWGGFCGSFSWPPALWINSANIKRACLSGQSLPTGGVGINKGRCVVKVQAWLGGSGLYLCGECVRGHCATLIFFPPVTLNMASMGPAAILAVVSEKGERGWKSSKSNSHALQNEHITDTAATYRLHVCRPGAVCRATPPPPSTPYFHPHRDSRTGQKEANWCSSIWVQVDGFNSGMSDIVFLLWGFSMRPTQIGHGNAVGKTLTTLSFHATNSDSD